MASIHYGFPTTESIDITTMAHNSSEPNQLIQSEKNVLSDAYQTSIVQVLLACGIINNQDETATRLQEIKDHVQRELQSHNHKS